MPQVPWFPMLPLVVGGLAAALLLGLALLAGARAAARARRAEQARQELALRNEELEHEIAVRTRELADRAADLGTITDYVAHDLRNPLNTISVNTDLLEQQYGSVLGEEGRTALARTSASVQRMTEILDRVLGLSVVSDATFHREPVNLTEMVRDLFDELAAAEPPPAVELTLADLPQANADPALVRTLAQNLLRNALKYTRGRDPRRVEVGCERDRRIPVYFVRDNGVGFAGDAGHPFRAAGRGQEDGRGRATGLGLDIAVRVVRRHHGRIWAESRPGEGAAFYFTLEPEPTP